MGWPASQMRWGHSVVSLMRTTICAKAVLPKSLLSEYSTVLHKGRWWVEETKGGQQNVFWPSISDDIDRVCNNLELHHLKQQLKVYPDPDLYYFMFYSVLFDSYLSVQRSPKKFYSQQHSLYKTMNTRMDVVFMATQMGFWGAIVELSGWLLAIAILAAPDPFST